MRKIQNVGAPCMRQLSLTVALLSLFFSFCPRTEALPEPAGVFFWDEVGPGLSVGRYQRPLNSHSIMSDVMILKLDPNRYELDVVLASDIGVPRADIRTLTQRVGGFAGINGSFFDPEGKALGVIISNATERQRLQRRGSVLTGVFFVNGSRVGIAHRDSFSSTGVKEALQAGPRLIADGIPLPLKEPDFGTRRSGIAITKQREVLIYATMVRFPGAKLAQIQSMLLEKDLNVVDALNLDGGSSSQLYISKLGGKNEEIVIAGGDPVPVGLVVRRRE